MSELQLLEDTKKRWLEQFNGYALILIKAVLAMGEDDDMGDLASIERHHLKAKSMGYNMPQGDVKIIATEKTSLYVPAMKEFSVTQRLIVKVGTYQPVYMVFTNDPSEDGTKHNLFVPGFWMDFADQVMRRYDKYQDELLDKKDEEKIAALKQQLIVGVQGFGEQYERRSH